MFQKVLIANRGEIALRILRTLRELNVRSVAIYSEPDRHALHVLEADEAYCVGGARVGDSYLNGERILQIASAAGVDAIHPGYGLLSENAAFAERCAACGIAFIGPRPEHLRAFGLKHTARTLAAEADVPLLPGTGLLSSLPEALEAAEKIGYPVMLKSSAGGGGIGMRLCRCAAELERQYQAVGDLAAKNFGDSGLFVERFIDRARHIEVQIFGDGKGWVAALGERDCSVQRRHQKVIEETPAPALPPTVRSAMLAAAQRLGESVAYASAGTVEFIYDAERQEFFFLEVNTRLQVEHGITELVYGIDLVAEMVRQAAGDPMDFAAFETPPSGHAIEVRLYAEDPAAQFAPSAGLITAVELPGDCRVDHWITPGTEISPFYDPLIAKIMVHGRSREESLAKIQAALAATSVHGIETNRDYLLQIVNDSAFRQGGVTTSFLQTLTAEPRTVEVLDGGMLTTVQDYPGRMGYWDVGVPPSGPMDALAFRLGNTLLGNPSNAPGLECTLRGPVVRFNAPAVICLTGAQMEATLDDEPVAYYQTVQVQPGQTLRIGNVQDVGQRSYLLVAGGWDVPEYLGSRSTFPLGKFGGHAGRALQTGDKLRLTPGRPLPKPRCLPPEQRPILTHQWELRVLYGPHGAPDFFTEEAIAELFSASWEVHFNSARTGVRLIGPKPQWARVDGGEAGLHPSNIHDNAYAVGTVDFTGDMPVILGPDGPSLGGFVCPATVIQADLWKLGQLRPGDRLKFVRVDREAAEQARAQQEAAIRPAEPAFHPARSSHKLPDSPIIERIPVGQHPLGVVYRQAGENYLLIEYGELLLDLNLRARVHALMLRLQEDSIPGIIDITPGIRSLQVHFDSRRIAPGQLLDRLVQIEQELPAASELRIPTRVVHLPLSWDDESTQLAIRKYMQAVRKDAPWCPSNIEFIRRINGLNTIEDVKKIVYDASYLVLGLGDVYLGAPVATPIDPRHRLVTTKYNPARTWTPENAVGIGGAYLCVYGMEGPGGYQFVGRTVQMWNRYRQTREFVPGKPWLLRFFDQIRFYEVDHAELERMRDGFPEGTVRLQIEESEFDLGAYNRFLAKNRVSIEAFKQQQQAAFDAEKERWRQVGLEVTEPETPPINDTQADDEPGFTHAQAPLPGSVWKLLVAEGDRVSANQDIAILESMKMEVPVSAPCAGRVTRLWTTEGVSVQAGQRILSIAPIVTKEPLRS